MRTVSLLQLGLGGVGRALVDQVLRFNRHVGPHYDLQFVYEAIVDRSGALVQPNVVMVEQAMELKRRGGPLRDLGQPLSDWLNLLPSTPCIVVDVTAQDGMEDALGKAVSNGHGVVLANKKPLCAGYDTFVSLTEAHRTRYEATVGAGLPIISTLRMLLDTGDEVRSIEGCLSGTLGFLMTQIEQGVPFSEALLDARARGWTEPDPRDDLSGIDVARKALILARTCGIRAELIDIDIEALYPASFGKLTLDIFLQQAPSLNDLYRQRFEMARGEGRTLRYAASISGEGLRVGIVPVAGDSRLGVLQGPDNLVIFRTQRYEAQPLGVQGPGAGTEVTASAVLNDMLALALQGIGMD